MYDSNYLIRYSHLQEQCNAKKLELELVWVRLEQTSHHQQFVQLQKLKDDIEEQKELVIRAKQSEKNAKQHLKDIQDKLLVIRILICLQ